MFEGTHVAIGVIEIRPGERAVLPYDLTGREEVWYALSGQGTYRRVREGAGQTALADLTPAGPEDGGGAETLSQGTLAVTRAGEGATVACDGDRPLVLLAIRAPLPARAPRVEAVSGVKERVATKTDA